MGGRRDDAGESPRPDVEIGASARARKVRFAKVPDVEVRFPGRSERASGSGGERESVPDEVEPGVTYRDVRVRWSAWTRIIPPD